MKAECVNNGVLELCIHLYWNSSPDRSLCRKSDSFGHQGSQCSGTAPSEASVVIGSLAVASSSPLQLSSVVLSSRYPRHAWLLSSSTQSSKDIASTGRY